MTYDRYTTYNSHNLYETPSGQWTVGTRLSDGTIATSNAGSRYASEAAATLEALRQHRNRPHMNYVAVRI